MKRENLFTFVFFLLLIAATVVYMAVFKKEVSSGLEESYVNQKIEGNKNLEENENLNTDIYENLNTDINENLNEDMNENNTSENADLANATEALFIGDSRTVGLMEYAGMENVDFFCSSGMSVFDIYEKPLLVPDVGKLTLDELLTMKKYRKIYLMLGVNELGYPFESIVSRYRELLEYVESRQPEAIVFIQANLHVTKSRSAGDKYINNTAINHLNGELAALADNIKVFYLDANVLFDDNEGNLSSEKSGDNAHPYGKYYEEWGEWIVKESALMLGEEQK